MLLYDFTNLTESQGESKTTSKVDWKSKKWIARKAGGKVYIFVQLATGVILALAVSALGIVSNPGSGTVAVRTTVALGASIEGSGDVLYNGDVVSNISLGSSVVQFLGNR